MDPAIASLLIGVLLLLLAAFLGLKFYPPGEGYTEEKWRTRIAIVLSIAGVGFVFGPLVVMAPIG